MVTDDKNKYQGYTIKLYKKINSYGKSTSAVPADSEYLVLMNFDGMRIIKVDSFEEFGKSLRPDTIEDIDMSCERQKLYLYSTDINKDIFGLREEEKYRECPLIVITMLNFVGRDSEKEQIKRELVQESLDLLIESHTDEKNKIIYDVMGTLGSHDCVIVFRSNSYSRVSELLFSLRKKLYEEQHPLGTTYSIQSLKKKYSQYWTGAGDEKSYASIRITLNASENPGTLYEEYKGNPGFINSIADSEAYTTFGKYDMGIEGQIVDKQEFLKLYESNGYFSGSNPQIHKTNTRILNYIPCNLGTTAQENENGSQQEPSEGIEDSGTLTYKGYKQRACGMIQKLKESNASAKLQQSILRLIIRVFQANISVYTSESNECYFDLLEGVLEFVNLEGVNSQEIIAGLVTDLNILLDNRISSNTRDFEIPHSSMRFSGSSTKLLAAYSNLMADLVEIVKLNKKKRNENTEFLAFVTADIDSKIGTKMYANGEEKKILNTKIPVDMMFNVHYAIPWLVHEMGHFLRIGIQREKRNRAYFQCTCYAFHLIAREYLNPVFVRGKEIRSLSGVCNAKCCKEYWACRGRKHCIYERFDDYSALVLKYWNMYVIQSGCRDDFLYQLPESKKGFYIDEMGAICRDIKNAFEEAVADMFMINVLQIKSKETYLEIMTEYFKNNKIMLNEQLHANIVIRIQSILMMICCEKTDAQDNYVEFLNCLMEIQRSENVSEEVRTLAEILSKQINYYGIAGKLFEYLKSEVDDGMKKLLEEQDSENRVSELRKLYVGIHDNPEDFKRYVDFIDHYGDMGVHRDIIL